MASSLDVLNVERKYLEAGMYEIPDGSNRVPGLTDQPGRYPAAWCDQFQMHCLMEAGVQVGPGPYGSAWVSATFKWYRDQGRCFTDSSKARAGDLIAFEWGNTPGGYDHIGMIESVRPDGFVTIEGNVGNRVQRLFRSWHDGLAEFARPHYDEVLVHTNPGIYTVGNTGEMVSKIQSIVGVPADGVYGPLTEAAVRVWQKKLGITADGVWGPETSEATAKFFDFITNFKTPTETQGAVDVEALKMLDAATKEVVKLGDKGDIVRLVQGMLGKRGIIVPGGVDGDFGPATSNAVKKFQIFRGLEADGIVGPKTWRQLFRS